MTPTATDSVLPIAGHPTPLTRWGEGPAVLCLHALEFGAGREEWSPLATRLAAAGYAVIAPDWPLTGPGGEEPEPDGPTPEGLAAWLAALLETFPEAVDWVARGQAAAYAIAAAGDRCRSLAVISPDGLHPEPLRADLADHFAGPAGAAEYAALATPEAVTAWLAEQYPTRAPTPDEIAAAVARAGQPGALAAFRAWLPGTLRRDVRAAWVALTQPLLLLWGELASDPPLERVDDWLMPLRPNAPPIMIAGRPIGIYKPNVTYKSFATGPRPHLEQPDAVAEVLVEHLRAAAAVAGA